MRRRSLHPSGRRSPHGRTGLGATSTDGSVASFAASETVDVDLPETQDVALVEVLDRVEHLVHEERRDRRDDGRRDPASIVA